MKKTFCVIALMLLAAAFSLTGSAASSSWSVTPAGRVYPGEKIEAAVRLPEGVSPPDISLSGVSFPMEEQPEEADYPGQRLWRWRLYITEDTPEGDLSLSWGSADDPVTTVYTVCRTADVSVSDAPEHVTEGEPASVVLASDRALSGTLVLRTEADVLAEAAPVQEEDGLYRFDFTPGRAADGEAYLDFSQLSLPNGAAFPDIDWRAPYTAGLLSEDVAVRISSTNENPSFANAGDSITIDVSLPEGAEITSAYIGGAVLSSEDFTDGKAEVACSVFGEDLELSAGVSVTDTRTGQSLQALSENRIMLYYPIYDTQFDASGKTAVRTGDAVFVRAHARHPVVLYGDFFGESRESEKSSDAEISGSIGVMDDLARTGFSVYAEDAAGNISPVFSSDDYIYYAPLVLSGEASSSASVPGTLTQGDSLSGSARANHAADIRIELLGESYSDSFSLVPEALSDGQVLTARAYAQDAAGNTAETDLPSFTYYAPILVTGLNLYSDNPKSDQLAKPGDSLSAYLSANHPVRVSGSLAGSAVSGAGKTVSVSVPAAGSDQQKTAASFTLTDEAGQSLSFDAAGPVYYAPLQASNVSLKNSNASGQYVKDGDILTFSADLNHAASVSGTIASVSVASSGSRIDAAAVVSGLSDQSEASASLIFEDAAGNTLAFGDLPAYRYYAPIDASFSVSSEKAYLKAGDTVRISLSANHETKTDSLTLAGVPVSEGAVTVASSMQEGALAAYASLSDAAGNTYSGSASSSAVIDLTPPSVTLAADASGVFSSGNVTFRLSVSDQNPDSSKNAVIVQDRSSACPDGVFTLSEEGDWTLGASAEDLAGNQTVSAGIVHVILDRTSPDLSLSAVIEDGQVYRAGITLGELLTASDSYLKGVTASVTDASGRTSSPGLDEAITGDGKKTAVVTAQDMAGNSSAQLKISFLIDGTAPKFIVKEAGGESLFEAGKTASWTGGKITASLDEIWMGNETPDTITGAYLIGADGSETPVSASGQSVTLSPSDTDCALVLTAEDAVGNASGRQVYYLSRVSKEAEALTSLSDEQGNSLLMRAGIGAAVCAMLCAAVFTALILKRKQKGV